MNATHIKLQLEKLRVLEFLIENIDIVSSESTREMLVKLKNEIDNLLANDF